MPVSESRLSRNDLIIFAVSMFIALSVFYRDVFFFRRSFLTSPMVPTVTTTGPVDYPHNEIFYYRPVDAGAIAWQFEPWSWHINQLYKNGELPLWNQHAGLGMPLLGNGQAAPFDPLLLGIHLLPKEWFPVVFDVQLLMRYFVAGFCTAILAKLIGVNRYGAVFAGISFMLTNGLIFYAASPGLRPELYLPLFMLVYYGLAQKVTPFRIVGVAVVILLNSLGGFFETLPIQLGLSFLWFMYLRWEKSDRHWAVHGQSFLVFAFATTLGMGLSAFVVLPFVEYLNLAGINRQSAPIFGAPPQYPVLRDIPRLDVLPLLLVLYAWRIPHANRHRFLFFVIMGVLMALVAGRVPIIARIQTLPGLHVIRLSRHLPMFAAFCFAIAAGFAVDLWQNDKVAIVRRLPPLVLGLGVIVIVGVTTRLSYATVDSFVDVAAALLLIVVFISLSQLRKRIPVLRLTWGLVALAVLFPSVINWRTAQHARRYPPFKTSPYIDFLQSRDDEPFRIMALDYWLHPNSGIAFGLDDIRYLDPLVPAEYSDYLTEFVYTPVNSVHFAGFEDDIHIGWAVDLLNVRYIVMDATATRFDDYADNAGDYPVVYRDDDVIIVENTDAVPRAWLVSEVFSAENVAVARANLTANEFDLLQQAVIEGDITVLEPVNGEGLAEVLRRSANTMAIQTDSEQDAYLIVAEQFFSGWQATLDGTTVPIHRANATLRAVFVPEGTHEVVFTYRPTGFRIGLWVSALSGVLALGLIAWQFVRQKA